MDDQNDNGPTVGGRAADEGARAGGLVPNEDSRLTALCEAMDDRRLSLADLRVYKALVMQPLYQRGGITACRPSRQRIANGSGLHLQTIPKCLRALSDFGYVEVSYGAGRSTNRYTLLRFRRGSQTATGSDPATGSHSPWADVAKRLPLRAEKTPDLPRRGSQTATQYLEQPHSVPLARAASDLATDSREEDQGPDQPPKVAAVRRNSPQEQPAPETAPTPAVPAAELWRDGREWLMRVCSLKESTARGYLGRFVKAAGSTETALQLIAEAKRQQVANPQAWLMAAAKNAGTKGQATHVDMSEADQLAYLKAQARRFSQ